MFKTAYSSLACLIIGVFFLLVSPSLFSVEEGESHSLRRIQAHLIIGDVDSAVTEVESALKLFPGSSPIKIMKIKAYGAKGDEKKLLAAWEEVAKAYPELAYAHEILEEVCWAIVKKGSSTSALNVRLISLIAAAISHDVKAIPFLLEAMRDSCAPIRAIGVSLASHYGDEIIKEEILGLFEKEKNPGVRLKLAAAFSNLHLKEKVPLLIERLSDKECDAEEKAQLILAVATLEENVDHQTLEKLSHSPFSSLRLLAAESIAQLQLEGMGDILLPLLEDHNNEVRASAIKGLGILKVRSVNGISTTPFIKQAALSTDFVTGITAGWALLLIDPKEGERILERFLVDGREQVRALAAAAIASAGSFGIDLAKKWIDLSNDPFVKANLAICLMRQREDVTKGALVINELFRSSKEKWMWKSEVQGLFQSLQKSDLKHNALIPNFPEASSQAVHLELLNLLAICEDPNALATIKEYLMKKQWHITGIAAEMLLGEGDESAIELIRELLDCTDLKVRLDAALVLAVWGKDRAALPVLVDLYESADKMTKIHILEALGRVGERNMLPFLVTQLKSPSQTLRIVAAACVLMALNQ